MLATIGSQQMPHQSMTSDCPQTKSPDQGRGFLLYLVPEIGIEPTTYALPIASDCQEARWN
ncbi:hypothetical protein [Stenotrophomonas rhizophila]|uniref:hypothetical protein n=1 Tax=Stenotrophomonas rhizophila TaxID=216778 RepID=UPI002168F6DE|nr:hypothetical protein [Stenotrophomonas rhizophila]